MYYGSIRLSTNPSGADISIKGENNGITPIDIINVYPDVYGITLKYPDLRTYNFNVTVKDGMMTDVYFDFIIKEVSEEYIVLTGADLVIIPEEKIIIPENGEVSVPSIPTIPSEYNGTKEILDSLEGIKSLLEKLVQNSNKQSETNKFDTGIQTLGAAVLNVPAPEDVSTTGYTRIAIWDVLGRLSQILYLINNGPGTIFVRKSNDGATFSSVEIPIFAGEKGTFNNIYELRIRSDLVSTRYRVTEHESNLIINNFDDRVATAAHISAAAVLGPVGFTVLATYTVPTGYKAKVNGVRVRATINTAAVVPGFRQIIIVINNPVLGLFPMIGATVGNDHNAVGFTREVELGYAYTLLTGESIEIDIQIDNSTGGQMDYFGSAEITQYFSYPT